MIDVHVLTHSKTRNEWLDRCLNSMREQPCVVHVVDGMERDIAAGRRMGFAAGSQEYVSFVDSDDYVLPGAFDTVLTHLTGGAHALCTQELMIGEAGQGIKIQDGHHLYAARRDVVAPVMDTFCRAKHIHCFTKLHALTKPVGVSAVLYVYQMHSEQSHRYMGRWAQEEMMRAQCQRQPT